MSNSQPSRNLALELVRVTEAAALASGRFMGRGQKEPADKAAVDAMRLVLNSIEMDAVVVIGEGEKDEAPMLFNGEKLGNGEPPAVDIAVDPIDGTVNYSHGIPHACVSIALQQRGKGKEAKADGGYLTQVGVIYDPFMEELWTAIRGGVARLNGRRIQVSKTNKLSDAIVSMGFGKNERTVRACHPPGRFSQRGKRVGCSGGSGRTARTSCKFTNCCGA